MNRLKFLGTSLVRGCYTVVRLYKWWVGLAAVVLVLAGITLPPLFDVISLRWTALIGVAVLAAVLLEGAYHQVDALTSERDKLQQLVDGWVNQPAATPRPRAATLTVGSLEVVNNLGAGLAMGPGVVVDAGSIVASGNGVGISMEGDRPDASPTPPPQPSPGQP